MRKGHGSTKVPGVKLRPAAPTKANKSSLSLKQPAWVQSSHDDDVDSIDILKSCQKPFIGIVISASGVSDKANLFQQAVQLGAHTSSDLTDRVTHLICERPGSAKYTYCVEHGIPIMRTSWITDAYGKWLSGESIDVAKSTSIHRLEIFKTVRLCLTAIDDVQKRKQIRKQLEKNGGTYVDVLGKDSQLTHLLCGPDRDKNADEKGLTSKMQFVEKSNRSSDEKVHLVWEDWFWDCLEFKGILNENDYQATGPRPQRRIVREVSPLLAPISSTAEPRQHPNVTPADISLDVEEIANIKRVPEVTARLLGGMLKKRGFEVKNGNLTRSPSKARISSSAFNDSFIRSPSPTSGKKSKKTELPPASSSRVESSLNAAFKRTKSFAAKAAEPETAKSTLQRIRSTPADTFKRTSSTSGINIHPTSRNEASHIPEGERALFVGLKFRTLGEAKGPKLAEALQLRGGTVVEEPCGEVDFIIVRLAGGDAFYHDEPDEYEREKFRTECWIEQCMFEERICASNEHPAFVPLRIQTPIPGIDMLVVHISGLTAAEKTPSVRLIKAIGAKVTEQLSRRNTHLICPCGSGPKFNKAQEWQIPIISLQWLYATVKAGEIQSIFDYLVTPADAASVGPSDGITMADITNSEFVQGSSKGKSPSKGSDRSHSSNSSTGAATAPQRAVVDPSFSDSWIANALLSDTVPDHPPTSSPTDSPCAHTTRPTTPSPRRRRTETEIIMPDAPAVPVFASPTKAKKVTTNFGRVPSSATPSPLKIPVATARSAEHEGVTASASSATTLGSESASVLKDAIASLLGKRSSSDDHENEGAGAGAAAQPYVPPTRASKRSKPPPRTKSRQETSSARAFSRTTSVETLSRAASGLASLDSGYLFEFSPIGGDASTPDGIAQETARIGGADAMGAAEESMRVTYEDPSQRAEQRRLMSLIAGDGAADAADADALGTKIDEELPFLEKMVMVGELQDENKKRQPQPRRRGRNLVRRAGQS